MPSEQKMLMDQISPAQGWKESGKKGKGEEKGGNAMGRSVSGMLRLIGGASQVQSTCMDQLRHALLWCMSELTYPRQEDKCPLNCGQNSTRGYSIACIGTAASPCGNVVRTGLKVDFILQMLKASPLKAQMNS